MGRIVGAMNVYMDLPLLRESLPVVRSLVDVLVVADGRYAQFPDAWHGAASADGTLEYARERADLVLEAPGGNPWPSEIAKRNAYLERCRPGDVVLVVDADEVLEGDRPGTPPVLDRALAGSRDDWLLDLYREEDADLRQPIHRLFRMREGLRYAGAHHAVHVAGKLIRPRDLECFPGIVIRHIQRRRCYERNLPKARYYDWLTCDERGFRCSPEASGMDAAKSPASAREGR